jgi:hypothetical protein
MNMTRVYDETEDEIARADLYDKFYDFKDYLRFVDDCTNVCMRALYICDRHRQIGNTVAIKQWLKILIEKTETLLNEIEDEYPDALEDN